MYIIFRGLGNKERNLIKLAHNNHLMGLNQVSLIVICIITDAVANE